MTTRPARPALCAIIGAPGAGKQSLARDLAELLGPERCTLLALDDYLAPRAPEPQGADRGDAEPQLALMTQHLRLLRQGETVFKPVVDRASGGFLAPEFLRPSRLLLAHGRFGLNAPEIRALWDASLYLDTRPAAPAVLAQRERADLVLVAPAAGNAAPAQSLELRITHPVPLPALDGLADEAGARSVLHVARAAGGVDVIAIATDVDDVTAALLETRLLAALPGAPTRRQRRMEQRRSDGNAASPAMGIARLLVAHYLVQRGVGRATPSPVAARSAHPAPGA